jgi:hypothetical protein
MEETLIQTLKSYDYRYNRYKIDYSVVMWHCPINVDLNELAKSIRTTDHFICLDDHTCAIVFDYTTPESSIQALNHLLEYYKCTYSSIPVYSSVLSASQFENVETLVPQLVNQLDQSIENSPLSSSS